MSSIISINPATLEVLGEFESAEASDVEDAVSRAKTASRSWRALPYGERSAYLIRLKEIILDQLDDLSLLITQEIGKPVAEVLTTEIFPTLESLVYFATHAEQQLQDQLIEYEMRMLIYKRGNTIYEPLGVVAIITPWNYPLSIPINQVASSLIAGNTVVLKPSELTPMLATRLSVLFEEAEFPPDVVSILIGDAETGKQLVRSDVDKILFTGRTENGRDVMRAAAERLCPVSLQLSANDAMIILEDANLERTVRGAVYGSFLNAGQSCPSVARVYVSQDIAEPFLEGVVEATRRLHLGDPTDPEVEIGPLVSEFQRNFVETQIADALAKGAQLLVGGERYGQTGCFYQPTVLSDAHHEMMIMQAETLGPVMPVQVVDSIDQAVELANDSRYGLSASVWTADVTRAMEISHQLDVGTVTVNDVLFPFTAPECAWGGVRDSGFGRTGGTQGLRELCRVKHLSFDNGRRLSMPWWYPYNEEYQDFMHLALLNQYSQDLRTRLRTGSELIPHWRRIVGQRRRKREDKG